jgi:hypothetical protein
MIKAHMILIFTIEELNFGFDRFWLRRKIRNHVRFMFPLAEALPWFTVHDQGL